MMLKPTTDYEQFKALPPIDEQKARSLLKANAEIDKFIKEQHDLFYNQEDIEEDDWKSGGFLSDNKDIRAFLGDKFLEITQQPQHCALNEGDALKERLCEYYPDIFWAMYVHSDLYSEYSHDDVRKRKEYIYNHSRRKAQFLQAIALDNSLKDEHDFWTNYIYNVDHFRYKMFYSLMHTKRELPKQDVHIIRLDHYYQWLYAAVDEFVDAEYNFNEDITKGGLTQLYADNRDDQHHRLL